MASLKELMAARLAAGKKENSNVQPTQVVDAVVVREPTRTDASQAGVGDSGEHPQQQDPVAHPLRSDAQADGGTVVVGAELQPAVAVVLPAQLVQDRSGVQGLAEEPDSGAVDGTVHDDTDLDVTNPVHFQFLERLQQLQDALLARDPNMKGHLAAIHRTMIEYEELPNLLRPHEIAKIMAAQQSHTNVVLAVATAKKSKSAASKRVAQLGLDDI